LIFKCTDDIDIIFSTSWVEHNISGHLFEMLEYWLCLKDIKKIKLLFANTYLTSDIIIQCAKDKYDITEKEIIELNDAIVVHNKLQVLHAPSTNFVVVDGNMFLFDDKVLNCKNIFAIRCGNIEKTGKTKHKNFILLHDTRVYDDSAVLRETGLRVYHFTKKFMFNRFKEIRHVKNKKMMYITKNCRDIEEKDILPIIDSNTVIFTDSEQIQSKYNSMCQTMLIPVQNMHEEFSTYIYTPVQRKFDCSPRLIAECKWYNKEVQLHNIDYTDKGLLQRIEDLENIDKLQMHVHDIIFLAVK